MKENKFLDELEERLGENRRLAERSILPRQLYGVASYLGFHTFRTLVVVSLAVTLGMWLLDYKWLMGLSKLLFIYK